MKTRDDAHDNTRPITRAEALERARMHPSSNLVATPPWALELFPAAPLAFVHLGNAQYQHITRSLFVICSAAEYSDGKRWLHVSCSLPDRPPPWMDLRLVKDTFIGTDRKAIQVFPVQSEYVNLHPFVLHLWACLDGDGLPDFRNVDGSI